MQLPGKRTPLLLEPARAESAEVSVSACLKRFTAAAAAAVWEQQHQLQQQAAANLL